MDQSHQFFLENHRNYQKGYIYRSCKTLPSIIHPYLPKAVRHFSPFFLIWIDLLSFLLLLPYFLFAWDSSDHLPLLAHFEIRDKLDFLFDRSL
jgi:hypothetical protein